MRGAPIIPLMLSLAIFSWGQASPEESNSNSLLVGLFEQCLNPEQFASLGEPRSPEQLVALMNPDQKNVAREKLGSLELNEPEPAIRAQIVNGYELLGYAVDAYRAGAETSIPNRAQQFLASASEALAKGDNEAAARMAAEALAADSTNDKAFGILQMTKRYVPDASLEGPEEAQTPAASQSPMSAPAALALMRQVVAARKAGDMDGTFRLALDAMRADPTAPEVQELYRMVVADRKKQMARVRTVLGTMQQAEDASKLGRHEEAVALAEKAAGTDPNPALLRFVEIMRRRQAEAAKIPAKPPVSSQPQGSSPLLPLGAAGLGLAAYGVHRSRRSWAGQEFSRQEDEDPNSERIRNNIHRAKGAALALGTFAAVYWGPGLAVRAGTAVVSGWRAANSSFQRVAASNAGSLFPEGKGVETTAGLQKLPWTTWAEYPKVILNGREYAKIGERLYTRHAIDRTMPKGLDVSISPEYWGRSMSPTFVEDVIQRGSQSNVVRHGAERTIHRLGTVEVVTEEAGRIVVSVNPFRNQ